MKSMLKKVLIFTMIFVISIVGLNFSKAYAATDEISFYSIQDKKCIDGPYVYKTTIQVAVKNIAYDKKVTVHFYDSFDHKTPWKDTEAHYSYTLRNGYEIWTADAIHYCPSIRFSLKYEVAGQTYWDNNNGEDYISK